MDHSKPTIASLTGEVRQLRQRLAQFEASRNDRPLGRLAQLCADRAPEIVLWVDATGKVVYANDQACRSYGYSREQLAGKHLIDIHRNWEETTWQEYWNELTMRGSVVLDEWHVTQGGKAFPVETVATLVDLYDICYGIHYVRDISQRRSTEQRYQTLFENVSDLVFQATPGGRFLNANPEGVRRLGYQSVEDLIESVSDIGAQIYVNPEDREHVIAELQEKGRINGFEFPFYTLQREIRWAVLNAVGVKDESGRLMRVDGFVQDVTERRKALDEVQRLQAELAHVGRVSTMGEMATGLAHELNQPLASLKLYAQTCLGLPHPAELCEPLEEIAQAAQRAAEIVSRLRQFTSRRPPCRSTVGVNQLVQEVVKLAEYECRQSRVAVVLDLGHDLPPVVVDPILIQQVVLNLLRNAVQALAEKGPDRRSVVIQTTAAEGDLVRVAVCDSGPGVPPELASRMFDAFVTSKPYGMGMGLAISQTIVARHGGRLWYSPGRYGGSVFQFTLPTTLAELPDGS